MLLEVKSPNHLLLTNCPGFLGYTLGSRMKTTRDTLSSFFTNPLSIHPRYPSKDRTISQVMNSGVFFHNGYPNPGLSAAIRSYANAWSRLDKPIIISILPQTPGELHAMVMEIEKLEFVYAIDIFPPRIELNDMMNWKLAMVSEHPLILRLPLDEVMRTFWHFSDEVSGFSLAPPRGIIYKNEETVVRGRLFGVLLHHITLNIIKDMSDQAPNMVIIAGNGVNNLSQARELVLAGASVVQLDFCLWSSTDLQRQFMLP